MSKWTDRRSAFYWNIGGSFYINILKMLVFCYQCIRIFSFTVVSQPFIKNCIYIYYFRSALGQKCPFLAGLCPFLAKSVHFWPFCVHFWPFWKMSKHPPFFRKNMQPILFSQKCVLLHIWVDSLFYKTLGHKNDFWTF